MSKLITVSAKIDEELKRKADELGVNISALVRRALEVEGAPELPEGTVVRIIRNMREGRPLV